MLRFYLDNNYNHIYLYRQFITYFNETNICSGELLNNKFLVPCNPEYYLSQQYGEEKWRKPLVDGYFNGRSIKLFRNWTNDEWPYVVRWYKSSGELDVNKTLNEINRFSTHQYAVLPPDRH